MHCFSHKSSIIWSQPSEVSFFAYFDPKRRLGSRDVLFLICCPAHQREDVKQELKKAGLAPCVATKHMIPRPFKAFAFVSGGINFARSEDIGGVCLRLVQILSKKKRVQRSFVQSNSWAIRFGICCVIFVGCG